MNVVFFRDLRCSRIMSHDLITIGLACADVMTRPVDTYPERGKLQLVPYLELHLGGLAGVAAAVFSQLGGKAAFVGKLGTDGFGDYILHSLTARGVNVDNVSRSQTERTPATVVLISSDGERTFIHHQGASAEFAAEDIEPGAVEQAKYIHWGGPSVTPQLDGEPISLILKAARARGAITSMDTCYDGKDVWLPRIEPALPYLDIVFSSFEEACKYTGQNTPEQIAAFYQSYGASIVVVKLGEKGMYIVHEGDAQYLPAFKADVVDTTGAGDASCAGFLYGHSQGWDIERCGRFANAVGGLTVQHVGGAEGVRSLDEVLAFMENKENG